MLESQAVLPLRYFRAILMRLPAHIRNSQLVTKIHRITHTHHPTPHSHPPTHSRTKTLPRGDNGARTGALAAQSADYARCQGRSPRRLAVEGGTTIGRSVGRGQTSDVGRDRRSPRPKSPARYPNLRGHDGRSRTSQGRIAGMFFRAHVCRLRAENDQPRQVHRLLNLSLRYSPLFAQHGRC